METFTFKEADGTITHIPLEEWGWLAVYKDGSFLKQFDDVTKEFHQFKEIKVEELDTFIVLNLFNTDDNTKRYEFHMNEGMTPIFFYRVTIFNATQEDEYRVRIAHFGYKENINGKSVKTVMFVHPSGAVSISNNDGREFLEANNN